MLYQIGQKLMTEDAPFVWTVTQVIMKDDEQVVYIVRGNSDPGVWYDATFLDECFRLIPTKSILDYMVDI